jgi:hypothetical protein
MTFTVATDGRPYRISDDHTDLVLVEAAHVGFVAAAVDRLAVDPSQADQVIEALKEAARKQNWTYELRFDAVPVTPGYVPPYISVYWTGNATGRQMVGTFQAYAVEVMENGSIILPPDE